MHLMVSMAGGGAAPSLAWFQAVAGLAERGRFDAVVFRPVAGAGMGVDPMPLVVALAASTRWVGLGAAVSMEWGEPFNVARSFAGADRLTGGRTAWVPDMGGRAANFGHRGVLGREERYGRVEEGIGVVRKLWDSWEDEAVILDKEAGLFSDARRVHRIEHVGRWFSVRGPLNAPRPLQGHPVVVMADASVEGVALAGRAADVFLAGDAGAVMPALAGVRVLQTIVAGGEAATAERMGAMLEAGSCHGFDVVVEGPGELATFVEGVVPVLQARGLLRREYAGGTLREHLGLARPRSQFAA